MSSVNPYAPPMAAVRDVAGRQTYQEVRLWSAKGRIGRLRYLGYAMGGYLVYLVCAAVLGGIGGAMHAPALAVAAPLILLVPYMVFSVLLLIQRAHDMDWSGWSSFLVLVPLVALVWVFKGGSEGENRFGAPPPPNTTGVKILACLFPLVFVIGILAAIAIPAYQQYTVRARAAQAAPAAPAQNPGQ